MSLLVLSVVLLSALLHAGWNALVRSAADKTASTLAVVLGAGGLALPVLLVLPLPAAASVPYVLASGLIHVVYFTLVAGAYRHADLSLAYPLMRGTAPALTAVAALLWLGEAPTAGGWLGVALICSGVLSLAVAAWRSHTTHAPHTTGPARARQTRAVGLALVNAVVIAGYTVVDGQGARLSGNALAYTGWTFALTAVLLAVLTLGQHGGSARGVWRRVRPLWHHGLLGGAGTLSAYALVLWAMGHAPIASVAALRESAIVFAALLGVCLLGERIDRARGLAIALVCAGAVCLKVF